MVGLTASGTWMLFTQQDDDLLTAAANRGGTLPQRVALTPPIQDVHNTCATLLGLVALAAVALLMFHPTAWVPRWLGATLFGVLLGVVTGAFVGFDAVELGGTFVTDVEGYGFLFDGALDSVYVGRRQLGANAFRAWTLVHLAILPILVAMGWAGLRPRRNTLPGDEAAASWPERLAFLRRNH